MTARLLKAVVVTLGVAVASPSLAQCDFDTFGHRAALNDPSSIEELTLRLHRGPAWYLKSLKNVLTGQVDETPLPATLTVRYGFGTCIWDASALGRENAAPRSIEASPFDISLTEGRVLNASRFRLHHAPNDALSYDIVVTSALRHLGFIAPETFALNAEVGGISGRFVFQEHVGRPMLERSRRPNGPVFEIGQRSGADAGRFSLTRMVNPYWASKSNANLAVAKSALILLQARPMARGPLYYNSYTQTFEPIFSGQETGRRLVESLGMREATSATDLISQLDAVSKDNRLSNEISKRLALSEDQAVIVSRALNALKDDVRTALKAPQPTALESDPLGGADISKLTLQGGRLETGFAGVVLSPDGQRIRVELSALDMLKLLSGNGFNGQPVILAETVAPKNKANLERVAFAGGDILHSEGAEIKVDQMRRTVSIQQRTSTDWALIRNASLAGWDIIFFGRALTDEAYTENSIGLEGCLTLYNSDLTGSSIISLDGACSESVSLVNSRGKLDLVAIENGFNRALGIDLSDVDIDELLVLKTGGDCLSIHAGRSTIQRAQLDVCGATGITVGDNSNLTIEDAKVQSQALGISAWGLSTAHVDHFAPSAMSGCSADKQANFVIGETGGKARQDCHARFEHDESSEIVIGSLGEGLREQSRPLSGDD